MRTIKIGEREVRVCEHQGDINYLRFVRFKQWIPQVFEKMDIPVFSLHFEKFNDLHNKGKYAQSVMIWYDYLLAIKQSKENSFDAWGMCFALITIEEGEDEKSCPDDSRLKEKIERLSNEGLSAETVKKEVVNFMKASPEEFSEVLIPYVLPFLATETEK